MREGLLKRFLYEMTPPGIALTGGFITDLHGSVSPQIDLIAASNSVVPRIVLHSDLSFVPAEAALYAIEVKSKLNENSIGQVNSQNEWIADLRLNLAGPPPGEQPPPGYKLMIPTAIFAFDGPKEFETVREWLKQHGSFRNTVMICVVNRFHAIQDVGARDGWRVIESDRENFEEVVNFVADYWFGLDVQLYFRELASRWRRHLPPETPRPHPLEAYLKKKFALPPRSGG